MPSTAAKPRTTARTTKKNGTPRISALGQAAAANNGMDESVKEHAASTLSDSSGQGRMGVVLAVVLVVALLQAVYYSQAPTEVRMQAFATVVPKATRSSSNRGAKEASKATAKTRRDNEASRGNNNTSVLSISSSERSRAPTAPPAKKLKVPYPIFVASFSKSGTTSTFYAFACYLGLDYVAHRWTTSALVDGRPELIGRCIEQNVDMQQPPFEGCGVNQYNQTQTVVWTDTAYIGGPHGCYNPNIAAMEEIWDAYPHATLLLVRRNATAWFHSANTRRASFIPKWSSKKCTDMPNSRNESDWVDFYHAHTERVRAFAEQRKGQMTYVEVELESPDTGRILEEQIGLPESCWKHCQSSFTQKECTELQQKQQQQERNGRV